MSATETPAPLLVSTQAAAELLGISPKTLWSFTQPRGPVPCVRIGARVLYSPDRLREWLDAAQAAQGDRRGASDA